jgi:hypothetical protein
MEPTITPKAAADRGSRVALATLDPVRFLGLNFNRRVNYHARRLVNTISSSYPAITDVESRHLYLLMLAYHKKMPWKGMARALITCPGTLPRTTTNHPELQKPGCDCHYGFTLDVTGSKFRNSTFDEKVAQIQGVEFDHKAGFRNTLPSNT